MDSVTKDQMDLACRLMKDYPGARYYHIDVSIREIDEAMAYAKELWPDATVNGTVFGGRVKYKGSIEVHFNLESE